MKLIFSRKGFDSGFGELPSPILPDGKMISIPIPEDAKDVNYDKEHRIVHHYSDLLYGEDTYEKIIRDLNKNIFEKYPTGECHVDPDLEARYKVIPENWKPAFGQKGNAQSQLENEKISIGDIILFYGWFRKARYVEECHKYQYIKSAPDIHVIYGYMEIGEIISDQQRIKEEYGYHPHAQYAEIDGVNINNVLYIPSRESENFPGLPGYKIFNYDEKRRLTAVDVRSRGIWQLPDCFKDIELTYHTGKHTGFQEDDSDYFYSAARGQEFITETAVSDDIKEWLRYILTDNATDNLNEMNKLSTVVHQNYVIEENEYKVFCRRENKIATFEYLMKKCGKCPYLDGSLQGQGIECRWEDNLDTFVWAVDNPVSEFKRVSKLIDQGILEKE